MHGFGAPDTPDDLDVDTIDPVIKSDHRDGYMIIQLFDESGDDDTLLYELRSHMSLHPAQMIGLLNDASEVSLIDQMEQQIKTARREVGESTTDQYRYDP